MIHGGHHFIVRDLRVAPRVDQESCMIVFRDMSEEKSISVISFGWMFPLTTSIGARL